LFQVTAANSWTGLRSRGYEVVRVALSGADHFLLNSQEIAVKLNALTMAIGALTIAASAARAQAPETAHSHRQHASYTRNLPDSLAREATVSESDAIAIAQKAVPKGHVASIELEREGGKLIYSMDVKTGGKSGIDEVNVDAKTGQMVGAVQHEGATTEAAEAKAEAANASGAPKKKP
jgi:uncharacterized membrane protein YkoI